MATPWEAQDCLRPASAALLLITSEWALEAKPGSDLGAFEIVTYERSVQTLTLNNNNPGRAVAQQIKFYVSLSLLGKKKKNS